MSKLTCGNLRIVQLTDGIVIRTQLDDSCIPALRSGFAGYPVNPRWSAVKFRAWKTGQQWRQALQQGEMIVRATDSMLVSIHALKMDTDHPAASQSEEHSGLRFRVDNRFTERKTLTLV